VKFALLSLLTILFIPNVSQAQAPAQYNFRVWVGGTNASYDANGIGTMGGTTGIFYDQRGQTVRVVSTDFISAQLFGIELTNYETAVLFHTNDSSSVSIDNSITLTNGYPFSIVHSVTTSTYRSTDSRDVTYKTTTAADGTGYVTIITLTADFSTNYRRYFSETRDTNGNLLSWTLNSWTNDSLHSQQFTLFEAGENDEFNPYMIEMDTNTFDSFGNVILSTSQVQFDGYSSSTVTSNSYVIGKQGRILSSASQTDYDADGTVNSLRATTFTYDKFGNVSVEDTKQFAGNGTFQTETVSSSVTDQFGDVLYMETIGLDANGIVTGRAEQADTYVPKGHAYDHHSAIEHFIGQSRDRRIWLAPQIDHAKKP